MVVAAARVRFGCFVIPVRDSDISSRASCVMRFVRDQAFQLLQVCPWRARPPFEHFLQQPLDVFLRFFEMVFQREFQRLRSCAFTIFGNA